MPGWGQNIAVFSPLTYARPDALCIRRDDPLGPVIDVAALVLAIVIFQAVGIFLYQRSRE